jgi:predicted phosphatase
MRTRRRIADSSLELLLDTICNAFGGVLFIAILVTVLLRVTSIAEPVDDPPTKVSPSELLAMKTEHVALRATIAELQQAYREQMHLAAAFARPESQPILEELNRLRDDYAAASEERTQVMTQIAESQASIEVRRQELAELDRALERAGEELRDAQLSLKSEHAARVQAAALPRVRNKLAPEIGIIVRYGRVYIWHRYGRFNERLGLNTDEFTVIGEDGRTLTTMPKPYAGIDAAAPDLRKQLAARLRQFNRREYVLCIIVWPDSFGAFQQLRTVVVDIGFEYRLIPMVDGEKIFDRGGVGGQVQ